MSEPLSETLPPHNREAERGVIGSIMRDNDQLDDVMLLIGPEAFYVFAHELTFREMVALREAGGTIDPVTLADALKAAGQIQDVGYAYIMELWDAAPCSYNAAHYAEIVRSAFQRRRLLHAIDDCRAAALDPSLTTTEAQEAAEREILSVGEFGHRGETTSMPAAQAETLEYLDRRMKLFREGRIAGVSTGYADLDRIGCVAQPEELCVVGARTSIGKTAFAINWAANAALAGVPVFFVSLEQRKTELIARLWCRMQQIDSWKMRKAALTTLDVQSVLDGKAAMDGWPVEFDDTPNQSIARIGANARRFRRQGKLGLLVIDYLQLVEPEDRRAPRHEQVAAISRRLKLLARELAVPVVVLAQLNRDADKRERPRLSDLRESGAVEQDADTVLLLHRAEEDDGSARETETIQVFVAKQRNGPTDVVNLIYRRNYCAFENWTPAAPADARADPWR